MQRRRNGVVAVHKAEDIITTMAAKVEAVNMVGATSAEEVGGGKNLVKTVE